MSKTYKTQIEIEISGPKPDVVARWADIVEKVVGPVTRRLTDGKDAELMLISTRTYGVFREEEQYPWHKRD